ncbi:MAG: ATP-binding protein [Gemmatimonadaceae bacterium]
MEEVLRESDGRKDEFLATLAHELRNPLAPMRHALHLLGRESEPEKVESLHAVMERQLAQMLRLVDDLIDLSRVSRGTMELRRARTSLSVVIAQALETARPLIEASRHALVVSLPDQEVPLDADAVRLTQVFSNLFSNACKFSNAGGRVGLTASVEGDEVVVVVEDDGIGISTERMGIVFDLFVQGHVAPEDPRGGLGIGLTIVKRIVEMHGGSVRASSEGSGRGSRFEVRLPKLIRVPEPAPAPASAPPPAPTPTALRLLVADDNVDSADTLAMLLRLGENEVQVAYDGVAALRWFGILRPHVVLLDIGMPGRNGYETCRALRAMAGGRQAVVIAITGWGQVEDRRKTREAGFDGHLVKPVDYAELMDMIEHQLTARAH